MSCCRKGLEVRGPRRKRHLCSNYLVRMHISYRTCILDRNAIAKHIFKVINELRIKNTDISSHLKLPPVKIHCSVLAEEAIQAAIADYKGKQSAAME